MPICDGGGFRLEALWPGVGVLVRTVGVLERLVGVFARVLGVPCCLAVLLPPTDCFSKAGEFDREEPPLLGAGLLSFRVEMGSREVGEDGPAAGGTSRAWTADAPFEWLMIGFAAAASLWALEWPLCALGPTEG